MQAPLVAAPRARCGRVPALIASLVVAAAVVVVGVEEKT